MNKQQIPASHIAIAEAEPNEIYMSVTMRLFSTTANRNGHAVTERFIDRIIGEQSKYHCLPLCADTGKLKARNRTMGHNFDPESGSFGTDQIGAFHAFMKAQDEHGASLIGEARIPKRNARVCEAIQELFHAGELAVSFEIIAEITHERDGVTVIDAEAGNELVGMAVVSIPAYPEAKALALVAQEQTEGVERMEDQTRRVADQEAQLKLSEELKKKTEDENDELKKKREEQEQEAACKDKKNAELEAQVAELTQRAEAAEAQVQELTQQAQDNATLKAELDAMRSDKQAAELAAKQAELTQFAQLHGLDAESETVTKAIAEVDYGTLMAEANKLRGNGVAAKLAPFAMAQAGLRADTQYGGLLDRAE